MGKRKRPQPPSSDCNNGEIQSPKKTICLTPPEMDNPNQETSSAHRVIRKEENESSNFENADAVNLKQETTESETEGVLKRIEDATKFFKAIDSTSCIILKSYNQAKALSCH